MSERPIFVPTVPDGYPHACLPFLEVSTILVTMSNDSQRSPEEWFHEVATHYVEAQVLFHLNRAGVFEVLDRDGPTAIAELAAALNLEERPLATLLEYVIGIDRLLALDDQGRVLFTAWGEEVLERYGRRAQDGTRSFNFFDVRVGAYGPVWEALGGLLAGEERYGETLARAGDEAAQGVYKVGARFGGELGTVVDQLEASTFVELGVTSGLAASVGAARPGLTLFGLDRDRGALDAAAKRAVGEGVTGVTWLESDLFAVDSWVPALQGLDPGVITTVHLHEIMAGGADRLIQLFRDLSERLPGWHFVGLEQPLLSEAAREHTSATLWQYNHSNVLIHHLIGNGRILTDSAWMELFSSAGVQVISAEGLNYLGYRAYTVRL